MEALGPHPERSTMPPEYFKWLGIEQPPEQGDYMIGWEQYFADHLKTPPKDVLGLMGEDRDWPQLWNDQTGWARRWPWKAADQPTIADWIKQNEKPLAAAIEASKRPRYFNPLVSKSHDPREPRLMSSLLPSVQKCRELATLLNCRAMARIAAGDYVGAWQDLQTCQRLGRLFMQSGTLIESLVGIALVAMTAEAELTLLSHGEHSSKRLHAWLHELQGLPSFPGLGGKFDLSERFMMLDTMQSTALGGLRRLQQIRELDAGAPGPPRDQFWNKILTPSIDWDPAFRLANQTYDQLAAAAKQPDRKSRMREMAKIIAKIKESKRSALERIRLACAHV